MKGAASEVVDVPPHGARERVPAQDEPAARESRAYVVDGLRPSNPLAPHLAVAAEQEQWPRPFAEDDEDAAARRHDRLRPGRRGDRGGTASMPAEAGVQPTVFVEAQEDDAVPIAVADDTREVDA
jgi:hypothetical protein